MLAERIGEAVLALSAAILTRGMGHRAEFEPSQPYRVHPPRPTTGAGAEIPILT